MEPTNSARGLQAVLFDLDGTLIDTVELIMESFRYSTKKVLGEALPDDVLGEHIGIPLDDQMALFDKDRAAELARVYREHNWVVHDELIKEVPGTQESLEEIRKDNLPMAIITSKMHYMARRGIERFGLADYFEFLLAADDVHKHKPDPYPLLFAADKLDVSIEHCIYIGDSPHDIAAARGANAISVAALWGAFPAEDLYRSNPDFVLDSMSQLPDLVKELS